MTEKAFTGGTDPLVEYLGDGTHIPIVKATAIGAVSDASAAADGAGNYSIISALKRGLLNWATLLSRIPSQSIAGLLPVDTLGRPGDFRVQATSSAATPIALTATCRRVSIYATQGVWWNYYAQGEPTKTAVAGSSHFIAAGERLDFAVPANTIISVLRETTDGSIRITEFV